MIQEYKGNNREARLSRVWQVLGFPERDIPLTRGGTVTPLHPGFLNRGKGPDFKNAVLQFNDDPPVTTDVEIDWTDREWRLHGHDSDSEFDSVGLRVVWDCKGTETFELNQAEPPLIRLRPFLEGPEWNWAMGLEPETTWTHPKAIRFAGKCRKVWNRMSVSEIRRALERIALVRLWNKGDGIRIRAQRLGWDQAFWESLISVLGFQKNYWPFRRLAELGSLWIQHDSDHSSVLARLSGLAGLLPNVTTKDDVESSRYLQEIWSYWWREQHYFQEFILPDSMWRRDQIRPLNFPERRLALAAFWACSGALTERVWYWANQVPGADQRSQKKWRRQLYDLLSGSARHDFWSHRANWRRRLNQPAGLMGQGLFNEIVVNAILPWIWAREYAEERAHRLIEIEQIYLNWPATPDNSRLRNLNWRLMGNKMQIRKMKAGAVQGLLGVSRFYCEKFNSLCEGCPMPDRLSREKYIH